MKFKLIESYEHDVNYYSKLIDLGKHSVDQSPLFDSLELLDLLQERYSDDELLEILMDNGYELKGDEDVSDILLFDMSLFDYYKIPEFQKILEEEVFPEIDQIIKDEKDFESEMGPYGSFYQELDGQRSL